METILSGIQPSGALHIGNYLGAVQNWVRLQETPGFRCLYCIVDLHALTQDYEPREMSPRVVEMAADIIACGIDPSKVTLFVQSHVPEHAELAWILSCVTPSGELHRMTQFKDKSEKQADNVNAGILTYPILMAADILIYRATKVPVGQDQVQHLELTREIARRFNGRFGHTFAEPQPLHTTAPKILGLDGKQKMSKSLGNSILVTEEPDAIRKKLSTAYTDETRLRKSDPGHPDKCYVCGLHNYFSSPEVRERCHTGCATATRGCVESKRDLAQSMIDVLAPIREKSLALRAKPEAIREILVEGAKAARTLAGETMDLVKERTGLYR